MLKQALEDAVKEASSCYQEDFRVNASKIINTNFTRKRVLTMEKTINLLLSMQGGSLKKELYEAGMEITASAFVQQRKKYRGLSLKMRLRILTDVART